MSDKTKPKDFPDVGNKLAAPSKKSVFERHKAEAEAKRQREEQETAAVYEDFVKSFDDDDGFGDRAGNNPRGGAFNRPGRGDASSGFSKRHFTGPPGPGRGGKAKSGPGSLGPAPSSAARNREYAPARREELFAFEDASGPADPKTALQHSDDEEVDGPKDSGERTVPKPTLRLSSLPPGTSSAALKAVIPPTLTVEGLRVLPPSSSENERQSASAVVTLAKDTAALDIDTAVSALQNRYMGRGFYLSISRHLSSAANVDLSHGAGSLSSTLPFNARPLAPSYSRGPGGPHRGGFAPPSSYHSSQNQFGRGGPQLQVTVTPPADLKELKLIHKVLESLLKHGPEFEALLMNRKEVQTDVRWAWLWDSRSTGGVYYRWRLWDILSGSSRRMKGRSSFNNQPHQLFENGALWAAPEQKLPFEYTTEFADLVSDSDYNSSEDGDSGDEGRRRYARYHGGAPPPEGATETEGPSYLNPLQKSKLVQLLARMPTANTRLRRGDVARVTAFAIEHSGAGADEVVELIVTNVHQPFAYTTADPNYQKPSHPPLRRGSSNNEPLSDQNPTDDSRDTVPAKLVALYIISDILSASSTSGVRHAWRYRSLFESSLKQHSTFAHLGRLEKTQKWGRLRAEKWKRSVTSILTLWESWCVFPNETQEAFVQAFNEPPLTAAEREEEEQKKKAAAEENNSAKGTGPAGMKNKWRTLNEPMSATGPADAMDVDEVGGAAISASNAEDMDPIDDVDGDPISGSDMDEDIDGVPMSPSSSSSEPPAPTQEPAPSATTDGPLPPPPSTVTSSDPNDAATRRTALAASIAARLGKAAGSTPAPAAGKSGTDAATGTGAGPTHVAKPGEREGGAKRKRQRPKAEDMFADSDGE